MWGSRKSRDDATVTCIGCGASVRRREAREYDKYGDRWSRKGKEFEHLCKGCHRDLCHQPRDGLEGLLVGVGAGSVSREEFFARYGAAVEERYGTLEEQ